MNDRFRFRAWDKSFRRMIYDIFFFWKENKITVYELKEDGSKYYLPNSHIVLEQCTWLKDKNGRLIYENDYLKIGDEIFRVFWNSTKISLENMLKNDIIDMQKNYIMEIVGNAHEERDIREVQKNS